MGAQAVTVVRNSSVVPVASLGAARAAVVSWRFAGQLNLTVVVKIAFALQGGGACGRAEPEPLCFAERRDPLNPAGGLVAVRETVPQLRQAEVLLFGSAYAPPAGAVVRRQVRLAVGRGQRALIDKTLLVVGDRHGRGPPAPFRRMSLGWERAYGGIGFADNPLGVGAGSEEQRQPNLLVPGVEGERPGGFGPIPAAFAIRKKLLGGADRHALEGAAIEIDERLDWAYFQAAPVDQRADAWQGDEWIRLEGLSPAADVLQCTLPGLRPMARVYGAAAAGVPELVPLRSDLLLIEPDRDRCSLVYRGGFPVRSDARLDDVVVVAAVEEAGQSPRWPAEAEARALAVAGAGGAGDGAAGVEGLDATRVRLPSAEAHGPLGGRTVAVDPAAARAGARAPYVLAQPGASELGGERAAIPGAPWTPSPARPLPVPASDFSGTVVVDRVDLATAQASSASDTTTSRLTASAVGTAPPLPTPPSTPDPPGAMAPARAEPLAALDIEPTAPEPSRPAPKRAPKVPLAPRRGSPAARLYGSMSRAIKKKS